MVRAGEEVESVRRRSKRAVRLSGG